MQDLTRRGFIKGAVVVAAGAAAGVGLYEGFRERAVSFTAPLLGRKIEILLKGYVFADEKTDTFGIRVCDCSGEPCAQAGMSLSSVKRVFKSSDLITLTSTIRMLGELVVPRDLTFRVEDDRFVIGEVGKSMPFWTTAEDVRWVVLGGVS